jgi:hypothetical protein
MYVSFNCYVNIFKKRYLNESMEKGTQRDEFQEKYVKKTQFKWLKKQSKATRKKKG